MYVYIYIYMYTSIYECRHICMGDLVLDRTSKLRSIICTHIMHIAYRLYVSAVPSFGVFNLVGERAN